MSLTAATSIGHALPGMASFTFATLPNQAFVKIIRA
jgi:hypothetical protein